MSALIQANHILHPRLRLHNDAVRRGHRVRAQGSFDHHFKPGRRARKAYGRTRSPDCGLQDDVDVVVYELFVDTEKELGAEAPLVVEAVETEVDAVGCDAVYDRDDLLGFLAALLDADCGGGWLAG